MQKLTSGQQRHLWPAADAYAELAFDELTSGAAHDAQTHGDDGGGGSPANRGRGLYVDSHTRRGKIRYGAAPVARPPPGALERSLYYDEPAAPEPELAHLRPAPRGVHASDHMGELLTDHATPPSQRHRVSVLEPTGSLGANFVGNESDGPTRPSPICRRAADTRCRRRGP